MIAHSNPYDEVPYKSHSIEWTAPERLALTSLLHGGPRSPLDSYRVLELGCGNGANLLPLAYYRKHATFVGVDGAHSQLEKAKTKKTALGLSNIEFIHSDFTSAAKQLSGKFDYIIAHGIFSWVDQDVRNTLFDLCSQHLGEDGLLYLNYNSKPGWNVRGMVRNYLLEATAGIENLHDRAEKAQIVAAKVASSLTDREHPYSQLMANEFRFVCENHISYVAHEFLAQDNHAYWRSEFMSLATSYGFDYVADADFGYPSGQVPEDLALQLTENQLDGRMPEETIDLLCYRQLHSPILTLKSSNNQRMNTEEFANLFIASNLTQCSSSDNNHVTFLHPTGFEVEAKEEPIQTALTTLQPLWPRGLRIGDLFSNVDQVIDDLKLLQRNGLIELRCIEPRNFEIDESLWRHLDNHCDGYITTAYHTRELPLHEFELEESELTETENQTLKENRSTPDIPCNTGAQL